MNFCGILVRSTHNHSNCTGVASSLFHECIYILATHISGLWEVVSMNGHSNEELNVQQVDPSGYYCSGGRCLDQRKAIIPKLLRVLRGRVTARRRHRGFQGDEFIKSNHAMVHRGDKDNFYGTCVSGRTRLGCWSCRAAQYDTGSARWNFMELQKDCGLP